MLDGKTYMGGSAFPNVLMKTPKLIREPLSALGGSMTVFTPVSSKLDMRSLEIS